MPVPALIPTIVGSIIGNAADELATAPRPQDVAVPLVAVPRMLPAEAAKGELFAVGPMNVEIDGRPMMLSPGVQIRDPFNMLVFPGLLQGRMPVRYQADPAGNVVRIWILSAQEAAQP